MSHSLFYDFAHFLLYFFFKKFATVLIPKLLIGFVRLSQITEAVTRRCSVEKMFVEVLQNSQENTCARVSF